VDYCRDSEAGKILMPDAAAYGWKRGIHGKTDSVIRSWLTRTEDYHKVYIMPNGKFTKTARMPRALNGDEWHP
jgi:hypothetical protein